jgi:photosystem I subunit 12
MGRFPRTASMASALTSPEIFIALVVAAHAAVLALRLSISLYEA